jgi:Ca-activated chloride channel family protein
LWATRAIGSLLTQIRLHGEDPELVQSVVNLSIRYGIITPYTSYLIEEDDIFSQTGRDDILEESRQFFAAPAEVSGEAAVSAAADQAEMAEAEAPMMALPTASVIAKDGSITTVDEVVKNVGSKTFVLREGTWIDTAYDSDSLFPQEVGFASDVYFDLLSAAPEIGQYLALGPSVLVVHAGEAYQIIDGEGQEVVNLPDFRPTDIVSPSNDPQPENATPVPTTNNDSSAVDESVGGLCGAAAALPMGLIALAVVTGRKYRPGRNKTTR